MIRAVSAVRPSATRRSVFLGRPLPRGASWTNTTASAIGEEPRFVEQYDYAV